MQRRARPHIAQRRGQGASSDLSPCYRGRFAQRCDASFAIAHLEFPDAISRAFQRACEVASDAWPFVFLGETYLRMGRTQDALDVFHEGEDKHHKYRWVNRGALYAIRTKIGLTYVLPGELETAESWIGAADAKARNRHERSVIHLCAAEILVRRGRHEDAEHRRR